MRGSTLRVGQRCFALNKVIDIATSKWKDQFICPPDKSKRPSGPRTSALPISKTAEKIEMLQLDSNLVERTGHLMTGANVHKYNQLLFVYEQAVSLHNRRKHRTVSRTAQSDSASL